MTIDAMVMRERVSRGERALEVLRASGARLPSPGPVATRIRALAQDPHATIGVIAEVVRVDPALADRTLKLANAPTLRGRRPVIALDEAITRLGVGVVERLAMALHVLNGNRSGRCPAFDYERFWRESVTTAAGAQAAAELIRGVAPEELWSCALTARVGMLAFASANPERYAELLTQAGDDVSALEALEIQAFTASHLWVGRALISEWGVPGVFEQALSGLYDPQALPPADRRARQVAWALHAGWRLAQPTPDQDPEQSFIEVLGQAGVEPERAGEAFEIAVTLRAEGLALLEEAPSAPVAAARP